MMLHSDGNSWMGWVYFLFFVPLPLFFFMSSLYSVLGICLILMVVLWRPFSYWNIMSCSLLKNHSTTAITDNKEGYYSPWVKMTKIQKCEFEEIIFKVFRQWNSVVLGIVWFLHVFYILVYRCFLFWCQVFQKDVEACGKQGFSLWESMFSQCMVLFSSVREENS